MTKLQQCMDNINRWCLENGLKINASKTKLMLFYKSNDYRSKKSEDGPISVKLNRETIERVLTFKYLGAIFDSSLSFKYHFENIDAKTCMAHARLYKLRRL